MEQRDSTSTKNENQTRRNPTGLKIRKIREYMGLTQLQFHKEFNVGYDQYCKIESGRGGLTFDNLKFFLGNHTEWTFYLLDIPKHSRQNYKLSDPE